MLTEKLSKFLEDQKQIQNKFQEECKVLLNELVKGYFEKYPALKIITWAQYSPYFNDGDPCVFNVREPAFSTTDDVTPYGDYDGESKLPESGWIYSEYNTTNGSNITEEMEKDFKVFSSFIQDKNVERVLESMFGDGVQVVCTKDGIESRDHYHD